MPLTRKKKLKIRYKGKRKFKKQKCSFYVDGARCGRNAVGKSTLCEKHGGLKYDPSLALTPRQTSEIVSGTKFKPELHPIKYIEFSREGLSTVEIAAEFEIGMPTLERWAETYQEFMIAFEIGQVLHEAWWLAKGKDGLNVRGFNTVLYKFLTGNKLGYSDKMESKNFNLNQNIHGVLVVPAKVTAEEWEANFDKN